MGLISEFLNNINQEAKMRYKREQLQLHLMQQQIQKEQEYATLMQVAYELSLCITGNLPHMPIHGASDLKPVGMHMYNGHIYFIFEVLSSSNELRPRLHLEQMKDAINRDITFFRQRQINPYVIPEQIMACYPYLMSGIQLTEIQQQGISYRLTFVL